MNEYESDDLDFVTSHGQTALRDASKPLGFVPSVNRRQFEHPEIDWLVEFPPGPLAFGDTLVVHEDVPMLETRFGPLRIVGHGDEQLAGLESNNRCRPGTTDAGGAPDLTPDVT